MQGVVVRLPERLGTEVQDRELWAGVHRRFAELIEGRHDQELGETFFNSVTRRIFSTVGVIPGIEFLDVHPLPEPAAARAPIFRRYVRIDDSQTLIREILEDLFCRDLFEDVGRDARLAGQALDAQLARRGLAEATLTAEVLDPVFFRNKGAYVIGRMRCGNVTSPLVLPLVHRPEGVRVDAVLTRTDDVSIVFSFTRSYFHVEIEQHRELIAFLRSILPDKPVAELYTSLGYNKHGKTMLYRDLRDHLDRSSDRFVFAKGTRGLVMEVFTLPSYGVVFKVIRDRFPHPKRTTRARVMDSYRLVHRRDRVGRLVDAQEFEHLTFARERFDPGLLDELLRSASNTVSVNHDEVVIRHLYTERRVTPLDVFVREASFEAASEAVIDYGHSIRDLAAANIFPGDLLLKNFGVTRHGRAVFYDYDEIALLTECSFRKIPEARHDEDEMSDEPWFAVAPEDIFPEEFERFLGLPKPLREVFTRHHGELFTCAYWRRMQERVAAEEMVDVIPYGEESRLGDDDEG